MTNTKTRKLTLRTNGVNFKPVCLELDEETRGLLTEAITHFTTIDEETTTVSKGDATVSTKTTTVKHVPTIPYALNMALKTALGKL